MKKIFVVMLSLILGALSYVFFNSTKENINNCSSRFAIFSSNVKIESNISFVFFEHDGVLTLSGIFHDHGNSLPIYRQIHFKYKLSKGFLILESLKIKRLNGDLIVSDFDSIPLPEFYLKEGSEITFDISKNNAGTLFSRGKVPLFYCWYD